MHAILPAPFRPHPYQLGHTQTHNNITHPTPLGPLLQHGLPDAAAALEDACCEAGLAPAELGGALANLWAATGRGGQAAAARLSAGGLRAWACEAARAAGRPIGHTHFPLRMPRLLCEPSAWLLCLRLRQPPVCHVLQVASGPTAAAARPCRSRQASRQGSCPRRRASSGCMSARSCSSYEPSPSTLAQSLQTTLWYNAQPRPSGHI